MAPVGLSHLFVKLRVSGGDLDAAVMPTMIHQGALPGLNQLVVSWSVLPVEVGSMFLGAAPRGCPLIARYGQYRLSARPESRALRSLSRRSNWHPYSSGSR